MSNLPALTCCSQGAFTPMPDAKISVVDRGCIVGDSVHEVATVFAGYLFRFAQKTTLFRAGFLSEAAASHVWIGKDGRVSGTPQNNLVLNRIRYWLIEKICRSRNIPYALRRISRDEVANAGEVPLSSDTKEVMPFTTLNSQLFGAGQPKPKSTQRTPHD